MFDQWIDAHQAAICQATIAWRRKQHDTTSDDFIRVGAEMALRLLGQALRGEVNWAEASRAGTKQGLARGVSMKALVESAYGLYQAIRQVLLAERPEHWEEWLYTLGDYMLLANQAVTQVWEARLEDQVRQRTQEVTLFKTMADNSTEAILITGPEPFRITYANRAAYALYGYEADRLELVGAALGGQVWREEDLPFLRQTLFPQVMAGGWKGEVWQKRKDGTVFEVNAVIFPLYDGGGSLVGIAGMAIDITERKRAEEEKDRLQAQLLQAQKMETVGRLAGGVAHDFNNMLEVIIGHTEIAMGQVDPSQPVYRDLQAIQKAARRSADLTRQLLTFARKQVINPRVLDLNDIVAGTLKMLQRLIGEDIQLVWKPGMKLWPVKVDPSQVDQVLANLAVNARDAITGVGSLTIETENVLFDEIDGAANPAFVPGEYVRLAVSDTGVGMDQAVLDHLFEPFFTTKETGKGTGLGLATVYGIIKQHNGFIKVDSQPGQGTLFKIYLPRVREAVAEEPAGDEAEPAGGTETVLLVEDEGAILELGQTLLKLYGYTVLTARTPAQALALAGRYDGPIHLLITDVVMPEMNGRELQSKLMALRPDLKVLYISGYTANVIARHGILDQGMHFLPKPFSINTLVTRVREVLDQ